MSESPAPAARTGGSWLQHAVPWLVTLICFGVLYWKIHGQAARQGETTLAFLDARGAATPLDLKPGRYELRLRGCLAGGAERTIAYHLRIRDDLTLGDELERVGEDDRESDH